MKTIAFISAAVASTALFAAPVVSNVTMSQNAGSTVTINYHLSEPGIVTVDIQTNRGDDVWISIGGKHLTYFAGDANKKVAAGDHTITWKPRKAWPDNEVTENVKAVISAWALNAPPDYMVVSLTAKNAVNFYTCAENVPYGITNDMYKTEYLLLRKIPAANVQWRMGSPTTEANRTATHETPHLVTLADDYYMGVYEVTQRQFVLIYGNLTSKTEFKSDMNPMEGVNYIDLRGKASEGYNWPADGHKVNSGLFLGKLRTHSGISGFDLPTDAQWEFACRAGCGSALYNGKELDGNGEVGTSQNLKTIAHNTKTKEKGGSTTKVGSYEPNAWGLYDMIGNVWEWCLDWYQTDPTGYDYEKGPASDSSNRRVMRGGNYDDGAKYCRSACRECKPDNQDYHVGKYGFRVACAADID